MPPRWLLPVAAAIVAPPDYDPDLLSCRERCEMLTDCDVRTWEETVAIRQCQKECPYDPEENIIPFTREDCHTISKRRGRDFESRVGRGWVFGRVSRDALWARLHERFEGHARVGRTQ